MTKKAPHQKQKRLRLDKLLVEKKLVDSREKAQSYILAGIVFVNDQKISKSGTEVPEDSKILIKTAPYSWVSRGGVKLDHAIKEFKIIVSEKTCMDVGASTGGFTDCLLYYGAKKVYAIDVGTNQLDWKIRKDRRVVVHEKTNFRYFQKSHIPEDIDLVVIDVSFIGLDKILPHVTNFIHEESDIIALIKPQFEAGKNDVPRGGIIRDPAMQTKVIEKIKTLCKDLKLKVQGIIESPILGTAGNKEYLIYVKA